MIPRDKYLNQLIKNKNNGFPKIITGVRRCGKSYLLKTIYKDYLINICEVKEQNILIIDLDDDINISLRNPIELGKYVREYCKNKKDCYVFIDEIQYVYKIVDPLFTNGKIVLSKNDDENIISFVEVVLGLSREPNIDLYVTGSNSKMLSSDIVTAFRDKTKNINLQPLSFEEFYSYKGGSKRDAVEEYMRFGGMPLAVLENDEFERKKYLVELFEKTYFKDILEHNRLQKTEALDELCNVLSDNVSQLINAAKIANAYESRKHEKIDKETVEKYIGFFVDAFLLKEATRYDVKGKQEIGALRKYYFIDTGLRNARLNFSKPDEGHLMENIIYNELIYNGYTVNIGTYERVEKNKEGKSVKKTYEIDFFATKGTRMYYIQSALNLSDEKVYERERKPYIYLNDQIQKILVENKSYNETRDEKGYTVIGLSDFLLRFIK